MMLNQTAGNPIRIVVACGPVSDWSNLLQLRIDEDKRQMNFYFVTAATARIASGVGGEGTYR